YKEREISRRLELHDTAKSVECRQRYKIGNVILRQILRVPVGGQNMPPVHYSDNAQYIPQICGCSPRTWCARPAQPHVTLPHRDGLRDAPWLRTQHTAR